jgi:hypothetical protein
LKTNTTLRALELRENEFTEVGYETLFVAMRGKEMLNVVCNANHACQIDLFLALDINEFDDAKNNRIAKILHTIFVCKGCLEDELPSELLPRFLVLLQAGGGNQ